MDIVLWTVRWQPVIQYEDDVIIFSRSVRDHLVHLRSVLGLLSRSGISLNLENSFSSRIVSTTWVTLFSLADLAYQDSEQRDPRPTNFYKIDWTQVITVSLDAFLRFVPVFACIAALLSCILEMDHSFHSGPLKKTETEALKRLEYGLV